jgi:hypothetical protein
MVHVSGSDESLPWLRIGVLQVLAAVALLIATFFGLREFQQGDCLGIEWDYDGQASGEDTKQFSVQTTLGTLFLLAFVWLGAALAYTVSTVLPRWKSGKPALSGALLALMVYAAIGVVTLVRDPLPRNYHTEWQERYLSFYWPIGFLQMTGNFNETLCGQ